MSDAPRKWWNRLDAAVKAMGLCLARADRCTHVSYADVKKRKKTHGEDTLSIGESMPSLKEDSYFKMYDEILGQLMDNDEEKKFKVWASDVERRDVY